MMTYMQCGDYLLILEEVIKNLPKEFNTSESDPYGDDAFMDKLKEAIRLARVTVYQVAANEIMKEGN